MKFSWRESWGVFPFASPGDLSDPGIKPTSPALQSRVFTIWATRECGSFLFCPIPSSSPLPVPAFFPTASENSPALDNSLGIPQGWNSHFQSAIQLIRRKLHRGGVNKKIIRNPFWSFLSKSRHVFLLPLLKSTASHTSSICLRATPFLQLVLMLQREFATSSHPSVIFLGKKKKNSPSYKMTAGHTEYRATWKLQFLPTWIAQLRLFELSLRVYKPCFVGFSGWEEIS